MCLKDLAAYDSDVIVRVLFVAYHFPPIGGGGVQRNAKFAQYLPEFGYRPIVVTGPGGATGRWTPEDQTMLEEVGADTVVHRIPGPEPDISGGRRAALERRLMLKTPFARWWRAGVVQLGTDIGGDADIVYGSLVPYESTEPVATLARRLGKPWIADLQDPWALDEMWLYPSGLHQRVDVRRMRRCLSSAAAIIMNTPEAALRVQRAFPELRDIVTAIPNGFDAADFEGAAPERRDGKFRIVHTGYLHTDQGLRLRDVRWARRILGGTAPGIDILPRSHVYLLQALEQLVRADPQLATTVEVVLAGVMSPRDHEVAERSPVPVHFPGYLSHRETVGLLRSADLLFLPMQDLPVRTLAGLVPGKTYEYLASQRPILAAVPDGDARDLLEEAGSARLCRPTDTDAMRDLIAVEIERWRAGEPVTTPKKDVLARYERRELTRQLADVLGAVAASHPLSAARVESPSHRYVEAERPGYDAAMRRDGH